MNVNLVSCYCYFHTIELTLRVFVILMSCLQNPHGLYFISNKVIHNCGDGLVNDKAKMCNNIQKFYDYYKSFTKSSWSDS